MHEKHALAPPPRRAVDNRDPLMTATATPFLTLQRRATPRGKWNPSIAGPASLRVTSRAEPRPIWRLSVAQPRLRERAPCGKNRPLAGGHRGRFCWIFNPAPCCRSSVVEHSLGKGEVDSSILSGSTRKSEDNQDLANGALPCPPPPLKREQDTNFPNELGENTGKVFTTRSAGRTAKFEPLEHSVYIGRRRLGRCIRIGARRHAAYDASNRSWGALRKEASHQDVAARGPQSRIVSLRGRSSVEAPLGERLPSTHRRENASDPN